MKYSAAAWIAIASLLIAGCAPPFTRAALDRVDRTVTFKELQSDPEGRRGAWVMLAGQIIGTRNTPKGTFIEVLQRPMNRRGRPLDTDDTEGRFIIEATEFLDAAVYHAGRLISVIGEAAGEEVRPLGEIPYHFPLVSARELCLWEPSSGPQFVFGIGGVFHGR